MRMIAVIIVLLAIAGGAGAVYLRASSTSNIEFKTAKLDRGDLLSTISATGTVEPEEVIDVGAQVAGLIVSFGTDTTGHQVDYRSPVEKDQVLAEIDPAVYDADFKTADAQLAQANATVQKSQADVEQAQAQYDQAKQNWARAEKLGPSDALSQNDYDMYKATFKTAEANVDVMKAQLEQARSGVQQAQAALDKAKRNRDFCTIKSPVKGVIIDRRVNIGQTVVSSLNAPSLFLIAKDLTRMQVWVAVNEADIGQIHPGQNVTFTCDAFPGQTFKGTVGKVRLNATMTQNVVTYTVEVNTDNTSGKLLPYLTANVQFEVHKDTNVLKVPNAALRWYPSSASEVAPDVRGDFKPIDAAGPGGPGGGGDRAAGGGRGGANAGQGPGGPRANGAAAGQGGKGSKKARERKGTIWVTEGDFVRPVQVSVGSTDGIDTAVSGADLKDGQEVVVGEIVDSGQNSGLHNPFMPQMRRRR